MADAFSSNAPNLSSPGTKLVALTPNDGADLATVSRALWVGVAGNVALVAADDSAAVTLIAVAAGTLLPIRCKRLMSTNTTASSIVAIS